MRPLPNSPPVSRRFAGSSTTWMPGCATSRGIVVLTDRQLIDVGPVGTGQADSTVPSCRAWPLKSIHGLRAREHAGVRRPRSAGSGKPSEPMALYDRPRAAGAPCGRLVRPNPRRRVGRGRRNRRIAHHRLPKLRGHLGRRSKILPRLRIHQGPPGPRRACAPGRRGQAAKVDAPAGLRTDGVRHDCQSRADVPNRAVDRQRSNSGPRTPRQQAVLSRSSILVRLCRRHGYGVASRRGRELT